MSLKTFTVTIISTVVLTLINLIILNKINTNVKKPYMDEIFHVPQAIHYCNGNYTVVSPSK